MATVSVAEAIPAGSFNPPRGADPVSNLPAFCRVAGVIKPVNDSLIQFELWMPAEKWNGKFRGVGNGGFAGSISYQELGWAVRNGYAAGSTDTGHQGIGIEAGWAFEHPEKINDFGYRAIHVTAITSKAIVTAYYAQAPVHSYFLSCSNGGRQALVEAQRYPEDYDGIVAGAPANYWTHLLSNAAWNNLHLAGSGYISAAKLPAVEAASLSQCDALDGVKDGIVQDPSQCHVNTEVLRCAGAETAACLTPNQLNTLKILYASSKGSDGTQIFPGYAPGTEAEAGGWGAWITGPAPRESLMFAFGTQFFKYMVFANTSWDYRSFDVDRDTGIADEKLGRVLNATDPNLAAFQARGGKLILYHGWGDAAIAPANSINYYQRVIATMGSNKTKQFVRLFMVPGLEHCFGGPGPNSFGQDGLSTGDPENNVSSLIERWVEQGFSPERITAVKRARDGDLNSPVIRTRPVCAFPIVAQYKGQGSVDAAESFACGEAAAPVGK
ncbi:MAG TPA: tannase/feruloyl esterase family alpha/beta hydrolase [Bryobacteraceae bacterium]|nr:tannase/feruloyl esterase family alpha/beta hydrolase [Bryobacteraceae bacterium]